MPTGGVSQTHDVSIIQALLYEAERRIAVVARPPSFGAPLVPQQTCERSLADLRSDLDQLTSEVPRQEAAMRQITDALDELYLAAMRSDAIDGCSQNVESRLSQTVERLEALPLSAVSRAVHALMECIVDTDLRLRRAQEAEERAGNNARALQIREQLSQVRSWDARIFELGKEVGTLVRRQERLLDHGRDAVDRCRPHPFQ